MNPENRKIGLLRDLLVEMGPLKVAVSGGVDSMTLAIVAGRSLGDEALICHAVSPAVPAEATSRVQDTAAREGWRIHIFDAGEFHNPDYLSNPYDRCFHCKSSLYTTMVKMTGDDGTQLVSGTNLDDLDDYRPGLSAAREHGVRHPFVECGVDKAGVRLIARSLGYPDLARLAASPCLSSRIETGLPIVPDQLAFVHQVERSLQQDLQPEVVRCRILSDRITIQLDPECLERLNGEREHWQSSLQELARQRDLPSMIHFEPYRMGSAFVQPG